MQKRRNVPIGGLDEKEEKSQVCFFQKAQFPLSYQIGYS